MVKLLDEKEEKHLQMLLTHRSRFLRLPLSFLVIIIIFPPISLHKQQPVSWT